MPPSRSQTRAPGAPAGPDLDSLVVFAIVARERSLTRAADILGVTQPSVSGRIRRLERRLGEPLFERLGRGVRLTAAGELLRPVADRALAVAHDTDELVDGLAGHTSGLVRGAASTTIAGYLLPVAIARLHAQRPGVDVDVQVGNTADVAELVEQGEVPWGLVEGPVDAGRFTVRPFATDELLVVVPAAHPWARLDRLPPAALAAQPFVGREPGSGTGAIYDAALAAVGVRLRPHVRLAHSRGIAAAIAAGAGVGIVSAIVAAPFLASGQLARVTLDGLDLSRPLSAIQLPGRTPGRLDALLLQFMGAGSGDAAATAPAAGRPRPAAAG